ncbi:MAG: hypothetical protein WAL26_18900 [Mycobacterium sp.]
MSLGNYREALSTLQPLQTGLHSAPAAAEIFTAAYIPDTVEAMVALDRVADAVPLIEGLENNGARLDRPWMLATGARARAMLLAAPGDIDDACAAADRAMTEHERLPMPFERARTQLVLGQLQRRLRRKDAAMATLSESLATFEAMGARLWFERTAAELARTKFGPRKIAGLTPSEQRVAELATKGMTNRDVAAELFISPKRWCSRCSGRAQRMSSSRPARGPESRRNGSPSRPPRPTGRRLVRGRVLTLVLAGGYTSSAPRQ